MRARRAALALALGLAFMVPVGAAGAGDRLPLACDELALHEPYWQEQGLDLAMANVAGGYDFSFTSESPDAQQTFRFLMEAGEVFSITVNGKPPATFPVTANGIAGTLPDPGAGTRGVELHHGDALIASTVCEFPAPPAEPGQQPRTTAARQEPEEDAGAGFPVVPVGLAVGAVAAVCGIEVVRRVRRGRVLAEQGPSGGCRCTGMEVKLDEDLPGEAIKGAGLLGVTFRVCFRILCHCSGRIGDTCVCGLNLRSATVRTPLGTFTPDLSRPDTVNAHVVQHCTNVGEQGAPARACAQFRLYGADSFRGGLGLPGATDTGATLGALTDATVDWEFEKFCDGDSGRVRVTTAHTWSGASLQGTTRVVSASGI